MKTSEHSAVSMHSFPQSKSSSANWTELKDLLKSENGPERSKHGAVLYEAVGLSLNIG